MNNTIFSKSKKLIIFSLISGMIHITGFSQGNKTTTELPFPQPKLEYTYNALEPYIDAQTMEIHYSRHHAAYTKNFNQAVIDNNLQGKTIEEIFAQVSKLPASVRNNGGGYYNHNLYFHIMGPKKGGEPSGKLANQINQDFGSFTKFKEEFSKAALGQFGSGWAWLILTEGKLTITNTSNQDNPLMDISPVKGKPILAIDVWEHAYYLKYQNKRVDYVNAFWNVIDWGKVEELYLKM
jgi:superoxide dismutase, Fe-Mn family